MDEPLSPEQKARDLRKLSRMSLIFSVLLPPLGIYMALKSFDAAKELSSQKELIISVIAICVGTILFLFWVIVFFFIITSRLGIFNRAVMP